VLEGGRAIGAMAKSADAPEEFIAGDVVISNTGPVRTIELAGGRENFADPGYLAQLDASPHEAPIFHISFLTKTPLISPDVSPPGQYLHTAFGAPTDAASADLKAELQHTLVELRENFPGQLADARFLVNARHSGQSPGMHRWAGHMMPVTTPIANLYNVGDGCTPPGTIGTEGAAGSAREVAKLLLG
jgi:phytoene dehydrogenase-like protein